MIPPSLKTEVKKSTPWRSHRGHATITTTTSATSNLPPFFRNSNLCQCSEPRYYPASLLPSPTPHYAPPGGCLCRGYRGPPPPPRKRGPRSLQPGLSTPPPCEAGWDCHS